MQVGRVDGPVESIEFITGAVVAQYGAELLLIGSGWTVLVWGGIKVAVPVPVLLTHSPH